MKNISIERQSQKLPLFDFSTKGFRGISQRYNMMIQGYIIHKILPAFKVLFEYFEHSIYILKHR